MRNTSAESNEFPFYLLLVRQYIFQLPAEDERVRAAAWMVHLRRLHNAEDLKLRDEYIKLLLFAMHSQCLVGPFAQPPQKDKGLEDFPHNFTFPDMMRHLIEQSNEQSKHVKQSFLASEELGGKFKAHEGSEGAVLSDAGPISQTCTFRRNFENKIRFTQEKQSIVTSTAADRESSVLTSVRSPFRFEPGVLNLEKKQKKEGMKSADDINEGLQQHVKNFRLNLHRLHTPNFLENNLSGCEGDRKKNQNVNTNQSRERNWALRNLNQFTDTFKTNIQDDIKLDYQTDDRNRYCPHTYSAHSRYQQSSPHHRRKSSVCFMDGQETDPRNTLPKENGDTGRTYKNEVSPQISSKTCMTTYDKQGFSLNYGHKCSNTDFGVSRRQHEIDTGWFNEKSPNHLEISTILSKSQLGAEKQTTNICDHQTRENHRYSHIMSPGTKHFHGDPLELNNSKFNAECRSSCETMEHDNLFPGGIVHNNSVKQSYITNNSSTRYDAKISENFEHKKTVMCACGNFHSCNMKHCNHGIVPRTPNEELLYLGSALPLRATDELSTGHNLHLQESFKQQSQTQNETQEGMSRNQRYSHLGEDISTDIFPTTKISDLSVAKLKSGLSADLEAYSKGYSAGFLAGYAAGVTDKSHSSPEDLHSTSN